jgi:hypothetical protein
MTIPLLEVSFNNIFEYGQGYVALSRATCLEGLTLRSFQVLSYIYFLLFTSQHFIYTAAYLVRACSQIVILLLFGIGFLPPNRPVV